MGYLARLEQRSSPENPSTSLANPSAWFLDELGARASDAGVRVSEHTALRLSSWWACTRVLAETLACLPVHLYENLDRGKRKAVELPLYRLIAKAPNPEMTTFRWREMLQAHVVSWGNAYAEIERDKAGRPIALWPLLPDRTRAERVFDPKTRKVRRVIFTHVPSSNGESMTEVALPAEDVLHIAGLGFDGLRGYSVVAMARQALGLSLAAEEYGARWFGSGSRPSGILTHPGHLSKDAKERIRTDIEILHGGLSQAHRMAILEEGMEWKQISVPPEDAQFILTREHQIAEICRWHRIPPHMVQDLSRGTFSNIEVQGEEFVRYTMLPWLARWEQEFDRALLTPAQQDRLSFKFFADGLNRGIQKDRYAGYALGKQWGFLSTNDICEMEDRNPVEDGDIYLVPRNMISAKAAAAEPAPLPKAAAKAEPAPGAPPPASRSLPATRDTAAAQRQHRSALMRNRQRVSFLPLFRAAGEEVVRQEVKAVKANLRKSKRSARAAGDAPGDPLDSTAPVSLADFMAEMERWHVTFDETVRRRFRPVVDSFAAELQASISDELGQEIDADTRSALVDDFTEGLAARFLGSALGQLKGLISDNLLGEGTDGIEEAISTRTDEWEATWPDKLANRESVRANGAISRGTYSAAGVEKLAWVASGKACGNCLEMDGRTVEISGAFAESGDEVDPGEDSEQAPITVRQILNHPPLHDGCECGVSAA